MALRKTFLCCIVFAVLYVPTQGVAQGHWDPAGFPEYLQDRGDGTPTSMFGTYIRDQELVFYPFYEFYLNDKEDYNPAELGYNSDAEYKGKFRAHEGLIFLGYGITDRLVLEIEAAVISAKLKKSKDDPSTMPSTYEESGLGDVQTQFNYNWLRESANVPGAFSYLEVVYPFNKDQKLVGTPDFEYKFGTGIIRGFSFGTISLRASLEYALEDKEISSGEMAVEYLKRLSKTWRVYLGVEGNGGDWEVISEAQVHLKDWMFIKLNNAFGVTGDGVGWYPEIGIMFSLYNE